VERRNDQERRGEREGRDDELILKIWVMCMVGCFGVRCFLLNVIIGKCSYVDIILSCER
jgi:hypothetical protein